MLPGYTTRAMNVEGAMSHEIFKPYVYTVKHEPLSLLSHAGVAKHGQRRKIQSLVL